MKNIHCYILLICAFTGIFAKYEASKSSETELVLKRQNFEEEAKADIVNLLSKPKHRKLREKDEDDAETLNTYTPRSINALKRLLLRQVDELLQKRNTERRNTDKDAGLKESFQGNDVFKIGLKLRNYDNSNRFLKHRNKLASSHKNILRVSNDNSEDVRFDDLFYNLDLNHRNKTNGTATVLRSSTVYLPENVDGPKVLNHLRIRHGKKRHSKSTKLRTSKGMENDYDYLDRVKKKMDNKDINKRKSHIIVLRTDVSDKLNAKINEMLMKDNIDMGEDLRSQHNIHSFEKDQAEEAGQRIRQRRSIFTQAGYTQDPDTCKTYNENLVKLWSNLSKFINVTEQPNERALHNIAMMIQAYLEHQNTKQPPDTYKVKHEGSRDKIAEVTLKIRKMVDTAEASSEKITKTIIKHLRPPYEDKENTDCQELNEESLGLSVDLLYKTYIADYAECHDDGVSVVRNKKNNLRKQSVKSWKDLPIDTHSLKNSEHKPVKTILLEDEVYNEYDHTKMTKQQPTNKYRRASKQSRRHRSRPATGRSGNQNIRDSGKETLRARAYPKLSDKKLKKSSLKSDAAKDRCEKYVTRKLTVSLRPVIERFMSLLECQIDNTLRSLDLDNVLKKRYYLYASKFYGNEDSRRHKQNQFRSRASRNELKRINTDRSLNKLSKKIKIDSSETSDETRQEKFDRDDKSPWIRKYSLDKVTGMKSATPVVVSESRGTKVNNVNENEYVATYNEYFQSPPMYDDYDGSYKKRLKINSNGLLSSISPRKFDKDKKNTRENSVEKVSGLSDKAQVNESTRQSIYDIFYQGSFPNEQNYVTNISDQQTETSHIEFPFVDLTKLRNDDKLIDTKSKLHVNKFESITEFLKRARDESLQTPEFAVPFALNTNKGYVELTHLVKYPKIIVYRPQFLIKNTMPYDDFLKTINNFNMTNDEVRLIKIVRHLPDGSVKVLFETEDSETPLEVRNLNENRRSGLTDTVVNYALETRLNEANENTKAEFTAGNREGFVPFYRYDEVRNNKQEAVVKSGRSNNDTDLTTNIDLKLNSDPNSTLITKPTSLSDTSSSVGLVSIPKLASELNAKTIDSETSNGLNSAVGSTVDSSINTRLDTASSLSSTIEHNPIPNVSHINSYLSKYANQPSYANTKYISNFPRLDSQSYIKSYSDSSSNSHSLSNSALSQSQLNLHSASFSNSNSGSHSLLPSMVNSYIEGEDLFPPSPESTMTGWWKMWKKMVKGKIKQIMGSMASLVDNIDHIVKLQ